MITTANFRVLVTKREIRHRRVTGTAVLRGRQGRRDQVRQTLSDCLPIDEAFPNPPHRPFTNPLSVHYPNKRTVTIRLYLTVCSYSPTEATDPFRVTIALEPSATPG